ncbi:MAG: type II toxin-antitoxin system HicB family antitoxin [Methylococcaceae bacterium]|jgi:predicted RNase H-like HicB family nuclease
MNDKKLTAIMHKENDIYVSFCPELNISSRGSDIEEAKSNLNEAVELFLVNASEEEVKKRYYGDTNQSSMNTAIGFIAGFFKQKSMLNFNVICI